MKRIGNFGAICSLALTTALGASLVGYAPKSCGCWAPIQAFGSYYKIPYTSINTPDLTTISTINRAITQRYQGKIISKQSDLPFFCSTANTSEAQIVCTYWLWEKPGSDAGISVTFAVLASHKFAFVQSKAVMRVSRAVKAGS